MKKYDVFKTVHLAILVLLAAASLIFVFCDDTLFHMIANDFRVRTLGILLWVCLLTDFLFIYLDFNWRTRFKKEYQELDYAVNSDPLSGIANRNSCDAIIESYIGKPLPQTTGCITLELTSLQKINNQKGRIYGDIHLQKFSGMLQAASRQRCFVGRNGGMCFLALFEDGTAEHMEKFLTLLDADVEQYNSQFPDQAITYRSGKALQAQDDALSITALVALSSQRCSKS